MHIRKKKRENAFFPKKIWSDKKKAVILHAFSRKIFTKPTRWGVK